MVSLYVFFFKIVFIISYILHLLLKGSVRGFLSNLEKSSNWLPLISVPSLLCVTTSLSVEVVLFRDCAADTVQRYPMFILTPSPSQPIEAGKVKHSLLQFPLYEGGHFTQF